MFLRTRRLDSGPVSRYGAGFAPEMTSYCSFDLELE